MRFSRRANWLTHIFTPSVRPTSRFPDRYGDEVSLVQPYDGGGVVIPEPSTTQLQVVSATAAAATTALFTTGRDEVARLYCVHANKQAGVDMTGILVCNNETSLIMGISPRFAIDSNSNAIQAFATVIPPAHTVSLEYFGGDAASRATIRVMFLRAPAGTVFRL